METIRKKLGGLKKQLDKSLGEARGYEQELAQTNAKADAVSILWSFFYIFWKKSEEKQTFSDKPISLDIVTYS